VIPKSEFENVYSDNKLIDVYSVGAEPGYLDLLLFSGVTVDLDDLRARLQAATISWRQRAIPGGKSSARQSHTRLLASMDTRERRSNRYRLNPADLRKVVAELRTISLVQMRAASQALRELMEMGCRFEYEQESAGGERHWIHLSLDQIPYLDNARTALPLITSLAELPQAQQAKLVQLLEEEKAVRHLEVRLQLEQADGTRAGQVQRSLKLASAQASLNRTLASISPAGLVWLANNRDTFNLLGWSNLTLPILGSTRFDPEQLLQASESLDLISDCLIMPFPLDPGADLEVLGRWLKLWQVCEEAAENLSMVSAWLRCLGSTGEYKRCRVCFRHVGEGMKKNCWLHHRSAKVRVPSRELHVSGIYQDAWKQAAKKHPRIHVLLNDVTPTSQVRRQMQHAAEGEGLAPEVATAAAALGALIHTLLPVLEPSLQDLLKRQFDACVAQANRLVMARQGRIADTSAIPLTPPGRALRALGWERFFADFFGSAMSPAETTRFGTGKPIDVDHPLTSTTQTIPVQKLALDLLHLSTWISVDMAFDALSYLNVNAIRRDIQLALEENGVRPTYQELAQAHHTTPQAIQQAMSKRSSTRRRFRVLDKGREELRRMVLRNFTH
jgi:hypothetical protein